MQLIKSNLDFLKQLEKNNDRDWFNKHKDVYLKNHEQIIAFADAVLSEMNQHDKIEAPTGKKSLQRIYRDTRFSKDKTPYKTYWGAGFKRATKLLRGGYFLKIEANSAFLAGGFWGPNSEDLKRIREAIDLDPEPLKKVLSSTAFQNDFGELKGEGVKTAPKGYAKDHPEIDLLRKKQFLLVKEFTRDEVLSEKFYQQVDLGFQKMRPFFDVMSEILTTNANGEQII